MIKTTIAAMGFTLLTMGAGTAFAATDANMSQSDMATVKKCRAMSQTAMQQDNECMAMMKTHPDMMNGSGSAGMSGSSSTSSGMNSSSTNNGMKR